jgi:hypothetical protein
VPVDCPVYDDIMSDINSGQMTKIHAYHNNANNEFWFFYPSSEATEIDSYVFYNYKYNEWWRGSLVRTGACDQGQYDFPFMASTDGYVYKHEYGRSYGNASIFAETGPMEIDSGNSVIYFDRMFADEKTGGNVTVQFIQKMNPNDTDARTSGNISFSNGKADFNGDKIYGRQIAMRVNFTGADSDRWGKGRLQVRTGGNR